MTIMVTGSGSYRIFAAAFFAPIAMLLVASAAMAQTTSVTDQGTPAALAKGAHPLGSYGGSELDTVNLFNGGLSIRLPLAGKDGRGGLGASVLLSANSKFWRTEGVPDGSGGTVYSATWQNWETYQPELTPGWQLSAGRMTARKSGTGSNTVMCGGQSKTIYLTSLTTLTFTAPDGTSYSFRDDLLDGHFATVNTSCQPTSRGTVWYTTDGTSATFVSDTVIDDNPFVSDTYVYPVSGYVYLRDGMRFRIDVGLVTWMEDRNGNRVNFKYSNSNLIEIRDTLGRVITITQADVSNITTEVPVATITVRDANGHDRTTTIYADTLTHVLREPGLTPTLSELWGGVLAQDGDTTPVNFPRISRVVLPADTMQPAYAYTFRYNRYGEVSRMVMPLGGRIDYEYVGGAGIGNTFGAMLSAVYRRVATRMTYLSASASVAETKTSYSESRVVDIASLSGYRLDVAEKFRDPVSNAVLAITKHRFEGTPTDNLARTYGQPASSGQAPWKEGKEFRTEYLGENGTLLLRAVDNTWEQRAGTWINGSTTALGNFENDPHVVSTKTTLKDSGVEIVSKVDYTYDDFNNVISTKEYDFGSGSPGGLLRETARTYVTSTNYTNPIGSLPATSDVVHLRSLVKTESVKNAVGTAEATTTYDYDEYSGTTFAAALVRRGTLTNTDSTLNHHDFSGATVRDLRRGNLTSVTVGLSPDVPATTRNQFDDCGNVVFSFMPKSGGPANTLYRRDFDYTSTNNEYKYAYLTGSTRYVSEAGGPTRALTTSRLYYVDTGQPSSFTGENGEVTAYSFNDALGRITQEDLPTGGYNKVAYSTPNSGNQWVRVTSKLDGAGFGERKTWAETTYDGLGRTIVQTRSDIVDDDDVIVETRYDNRGRPFLVSNPKRKYESPLVPYRGWTKTTYDALNRVRYVDSLTDETDTPASDGFTGRVETIYTAAPYSNLPTVTVVDQAGRSRRTATDAIGRVRYVFEAPANQNYLTSYSYDARANLLSVTQGTGTQSARTFTYDSFGRLKSAFMPECGSSGSNGGTTTYSYDTHSNLVTKVDPRPVTVTYAYDELDRPVTRDSSDTGSGTDVEYRYDNATLPGGVTAPPFTQSNTLGRLKAVVTYPAAQTYQELTGSFYSYDLAGRTVDYSQMLGTDHYRSTTAYNAASLVTSESYAFPGTSNQTRSFTYNEAAQLSTVYRGSTIMAGAVTYTPAGAVASERYGDPNVSSSLYHTIAYNSRLQPVDIRLGTTSGSNDRIGLEYIYGTYGPSFVAGGSIDTKANNGNIARINVRPAPGQPYFEQDFAYDELNRLKTAVEHQTTGGGTGCGGTTAPSAPTGLAASVSGSTVTLTWNDTSSNECSFVVSRGTVDDGPKQEIASTAANATSYVDSGLAEGTYYYLVVSRNDAGDGIPAADVQAIVVSVGAPNPPSNLTATNVNGTQVNLAWTDNSTNETEFVIERWSSGPNPSAYGEVARPAANATSYSDTSVVPDSSTYQYRIKACNANGCSVWVESNNVVTVPGDQAIKLDGVNDYLSPTGSGAVSGLDVTGSITVEAWVVLYDSEVTDAIVSKHRQGSTTEGGYQLVVLPTNQLTFVTYTSTGAVNASITSTGTLPKKQWVHVVGGYNGSKIAVFVNGVRTDATVGAGKGAAASSSALQIGRILKTDGTGTKHLRGKIDEVRISNSARYSVNFDPSTKKDHTSDANTKGLWKMNAQSGTVTADDSSSNGYASTLTNADPAGSYGGSWRAGVTTNYIDKAPRQGRSRRDAGDPDEEDLDESGASIGGTAAGASKLAATQLWQQDYSYDRWGNMTYSGTFSHVLTVQQSKNRVTQVDGQSCTYDNAGNMITEITAKGLQTSSYDSENRMVKTDFASASYADVVMVYDANGRRVKKYVGTVEARFIYNGAGLLIAEYEGTTRTKEYVYGPSGLLAVVQNPGATESLNYVTPDHLGTPRIVTSAAGVAISRHDYLPFGAEIDNVALYERDDYSYGASDGVRHRYLGRERDEEFDQSYLGARYLSNTASRFTATDPLLSSASPESPENWNRYAYGRGNPMRFPDPSGTDPGQKPHEPQVNSADVKAAEPAVTAVITQSGEFIVFVGGINNKTQANSANSREAALKLAEAMGIDVTNAKVVSVSNDHGAIQALIGKPNTGTAETVAAVVSSALNQNVDPSKIHIIAHSNGVPSALKGLAMIDAAAGSKLRDGSGNRIGLGSITLVGPNTEDSSSVSSARHYSANVSLIQSSRDRTLGLAFLFGSKGPGQWARSLRGVDIKVYETHQRNHKFTAYSSEFQQGKYERLQ
jgi:RHS repeat-associated protein